MNLKKKVYLFLVLVFFALVYFVSAAYTVTTSSGASSFTFAEDTSNVYNVTINNTLLGIDGNVTRLNITFHSNFTLAMETNGTNAPSVFSNLSSVLIWVNSTPHLVNDTARYFWVNASAATPGTYDLIILIENATGITTQNLTITITDTIGPIFNNVSNYSITRSSAIINWTTNVTANYTLFYRNTVNQTNITIYSSSLALNHSLNIVNLSSSSEYSYNILSCDTNNNCNTSETYTFNTTSYATNASYINHEDTVSGIYNITINNSDTNAYNNITEINITLPTGINFTSFTNNSNFAGIFSNSSALSLSFRNNTGLVMNNSVGNIWFSAAARANFNGTYIVTITVTSTFGIASNSFSVRINDSTAPTISTSSIASSSVDSESATITWTTNEAANSTVCYDDDNNPSCSDSIKSENGFVTSHSVVLSDLAPDTQYYYEVLSCDANRNCASLTNEDETFTTDEEDEESGSSGSSSTSSDYWLATPSYSDKELKDRGNINVSLALRERARIKIEGDRFYVGVVKLSSSSVTINVSDVDELWLQDKFSEGDSKKYEVTGDAYYDLELTLKDIKNSEAEITIKYLHELKTTSLGRPTFNETDLETNVSQNNSGPGGVSGVGGLKSEPMKIIMFVIVAVVILLIIGFIINRVGKIKNKGKGPEAEQDIVTKVKQEIKSKTAKHFAKDKVNVKHP